MTEIESWLGQDPLTPPLSPCEGERVNRRSPVGDIGSLRATFGFSSAEKNRQIFIVGKAVTRNY
jgi:hypothetical protein